MPNFKLVWHRSRARISKIGFALLGSFAALAVLELVDGDRDLADLLAPILLILFVNHLYIVSSYNFNESNYNVPRADTPDESSNTLYDLIAKVVPGISPKAVKWGMNSVLGLCFLTPIVLDAFSLNPQHVRFSALAAVSVWSLCLFTISIKELKGHLKIVRLFYCQLALSAFLFSLIYLN